MFDLELRIIQVQHHLRAPPNSGSGQRSQWDVEGRGCRKSWDLFLQKVSLGRALQQVMRRLHIRQAEEELDSSFQAQPTAKTSSTSPCRRQGGQWCRKMEASNSKDLQEEETSPKTRGAFAELLHCSADWRRHVTSGTIREKSKAVLLFFYFNLDGFYFCHPVNAAAANSCTISSVDKSGGFLVKKDISAPGIHYKKDSTYS